MTNLIISNICNASCGYCFANVYMNSTHHMGMPPFMSLEEFTAALDFLDRSGINEVRFLGGEPTMHPEFSTLIHMTRQRNKRITVFTNGLIPEKALHDLQELPVKECRVIVNMSATFPNLPANKNAEEKRRQILQSLGKRALPGFNIQSPDFDLSELFLTIGETGVCNVIRLGMALPTSQAKNHFVHPKQYRLIGSQIARQSERAARESIHLDMDCGFVRCMFSDDELIAMKANGVFFGWHCSPVLDICPGGKVLHCFTLSDRFSQPFSTQDTFSSLHAAFDAQVRGYRVAGVFQECSICSYKLNQECSGGCLSATLQRFQPAAIRLELPQNNLSR